ncbi:hypothetical protein B484DRAFT_476076, partial [Ochromonadaceae sp. CCMP2298]
MDLLQNTHRPVVGLRPLVGLLFENFSTEGVLDVRQVQHLCYDVGVYLSLMEIRIGIRGYVGGGGSMTVMNYDAFMVWWRSNECFSGLRLNNASTERRALAAETFKPYDVDLEGHITTSHFSYVIRDLIAAQLISKKTKFEEVLGRVQLPGGDGGVNFNSFIGWLDSLPPPTHKQSSIRRVFSKLVRSITPTLRTPSSSRSNTPISRSSPSTLPRSRSSSISGNSVHGGGGNSGGGNSGSGNSGSGNSGSGNGGPVGAGAGMGAAGMGAASQLSESISPAQASAPVRGAQGNQGRSSASRLFDTVETEEVEAGAEEVEAGAEEGAGYGTGADRDDVFEGEFIDLTPTPTPTSKSAPVRASAHPPAPTHISAPISKPTPARAPAPSAPSAPSAPAPIPAPPPVPTPAPMTVEQVQAVVADDAFAQYSYNAHSDAHSAQDDGGMGEGAEGRGSISSTIADIDCFYQGSERVVMGGVEGGYGAEQRDLLRATEQRLRTPDLTESRGGGIITSARLRVGAGVGGVGGAGMG